MIAAYRDPDRTAGRANTSTLIDTLNSGVPAALSELVTLGRTLKRRAADVLAYFARPGTSNGPTEDINARLEHLRGSALGFRDFPNYIARCLLEACGLKPRLQPQVCKAINAFNRPGASQACKVSGVDSNAHVRVCGSAPVGRQRLLGCAG